MANLEAFGIPKEEWSLLTNALSEPVEQLIVVESKDPAQLKEVERRLQKLVGPRPLLKQVVDLNTLHEPENAFKTAALLVKPFAEEIPLLVVVIAIWPEQDNGKATKQLAAFWRGMNQLRELWHSLSAQVLFLLSPIAYKHLSLNAGHLKRWISLKLRLWEGSTDLKVMARPGRQEVISTPFSGGAQPIGYCKLDGIVNLGGMQARTATRGEVLAHQLQEAIKRGESQSDQVRRYYLPLISESLAMGDRDGAQTWRDQIGDLEGLASEECEALKKLDERLGEATGKPSYHVFLSHSPRDKYIVNQLISALRKRKKELKMWLEEEQILPGMNFLTQMEAGLRDSACVAVLIGKEGLGQWQNEEMKAALSRVARDNRPIIPVLLPDAPKNLTLPPILANRSWVDLRQGITKSKIDQLVWGITGKKPSVSA